MHRKEILETATTLTCGDRNASYGEPAENMADIAEFWSVYLINKYRTGDAPLPLTGEDVAWMNVLTKVARSFKSFKPDNYIDAAAYAAIAGECRGTPSTEDLLNIRGYDEFGAPL